MIGRIETFLRRLRRMLSRSVWLSRLLRLPVSEGSPTRPGLLMIQIDGLSQPQCERALERHELPFLRHLIRREGYRLQAHYSGLPSTTPAVQAELFYGVKGAVPAFSFRDHESRQIVRMYEPAEAASIEALYTDKDNEALLRGGSAYSDTYTGGAAEPHFCPSAMGWGPALRAANPLVLLAFVLSNLYSFLRIAVLLLMELGLALVGFVRGFVGGQGFGKELKFVPTRVAITILLRELCVIGGKIDLSRGLPVIHINFLGYDEQSHRRGPRSLFAHWTLKGIDDAIARLWRAANHSAWRHYEVWVYSDHGQAHVRPYHQVQGYALEEAVIAAFKRQKAISPAACRKGQGSIQTQRVRLLGGGNIQRLFPVPGIHGGGTDEEQPVVVAPGPVAHVYSPRQLSRDERDSVARELAYEHKVPIVLVVEAPGRLCAWTEAGEFRLPQDRVALFGAQHPFLDSLSEDLLRLCEHPDAGDLVLLGWREGVPPLSFADENGAHAGASPHETNGFALLPADTTLPERNHAYLRPDDLRDAALHYMRRPTHRISEARTRAIATPTDTLRVMTYNVHGCTGMDGKLEVERIARLIARANPDVVALQELDAGRPRSHGIDQVQLIAQYLGMEFHFHPAVCVEDERYGDAILTHLPLRLIKAGSLPGLAGKPHLEPRGALWVAIDLHGMEIQIINTHLGLYQRERLAQVEALLGSDWLAHEQCREPVILCGDFNARPSSAVCRRLSRRLKDVQTAAQDHRPQSTFSGRLPIVRIDHIFISPGLEVTRIEVPGSELARVASDHLPLVAEVRINKQERN
jgi:endonuclease/exonuclease/phosphatase family metal-dependent hydrolase